VDSFGGGFVVGCGRWMLELGDICPNSGQVSFSQVYFSCGTMSKELRLTIRHHSFA